MASSFPRLGEEEALEEEVEVEGSKETVGDRFCAMVVVWNRMRKVRKSFFPWAPSPFARELQRGKGE
jgi:hypothetical protein